MDLSQIRRVLIVRLSAVGDIVHGLPVARALKRWRPELEIEWLVEDRYASLLRNVRELTTLTQIPRGRWKTQQSKRRLLDESLQLRRQLKKQRITASIDLQGLTKSALWPWLAGIPFRIGFGDDDGRELSRWLNNVRVVPGENCRHVVERNLALLKPLGIEQPEVDLSIPVDEAAAERIAQIRKKRRWDDKPVALLQPGAGWETKQWPVEYFASLGDYLARDRGFRVVVLWGPGERDLALSITLWMQEKGELGPETSLLELIELIRGCQLFVGGDTGPMHMAAALGIPLVALFGASDPVRNGPYGQGHLVLYSNLACVPCWKTTCSDIRCLRELTPEMVIPRVDDYLQRLEAGVSNAGSKASTIVSSGL